MPNPSSVAVGQVWLAQMSATPGDTKLVLITYIEATSGYWLQSGTLAGQLGLPKNYDATDATYVGTLDNTGLATEAYVATYVSAHPSGPPNTRAINTTSPLAGGGDLSADRTLSVGAASSSVAGVAKLGATGGAEAFVAAGTTSQFWRGDKTFVAVPYSSLSGTPSTFSPSAHVSSHQPGGSDAYQAVSQQTGVTSPTFSGATSGTTTASASYRVRHVRMRVTIAATLSLGAFVALEIETGVASGTYVEVDRFGISAGLVTSFSGAVSGECPAGCRYRFTRSNGALVTESLNATYSYVDS